MIVVYIHIANLSNEMCIRIHFYIIISPVYKFAQNCLFQITGTTISPNINLTQGAGVPCVFSLNSARSPQPVSPLRPSLANQSIVNALTKNRSSSNVRLQLFTSINANDTMQNQGVISQPLRSPLKRSYSSTTTSSVTSEQKDAFTVKLQRVSNHHSVRSKIIKEKFNEHRMEYFFLDTSGNILDLYQLAKRPKTQQFLNYLRHNMISSDEKFDESVYVNSQVPVISVPTTTVVSSLPGASQIEKLVPVQITTPSQVKHSDGSIAAVKSTSNLVNKVKISPGVSSVTTNQEQIVEKAKQEAYVVQRISDLQREGLWSEKRLPKIQEMPRPKAHWDFLLEEMTWLAADFAQERKWKKNMARKCARATQKYFHDKALAIRKAEKAQEQHLKRVAAFCAKEIRTFWANVERLVEYKQNVRLEEKRKQALDQHLSFIVDQTEKYSLLLAEGMNKSGGTTNEQIVSASNVSSRSESRVNSDG